MSKNLIQFNQKNNMYNVKQFIKRLLSINSGKRTFLFYLT